MHYWRAIQMREDGMALLCLLAMLTVMLALSGCGGGCICGPGFVCVKTETAWSCEPSSAPPTYLWNGEFGVETAESKR